MFSIRLPFLFVVLLLSGCATTNPQDPLEPFNRSMYKVNDTLDQAVAKPLAEGYNTIMPAPGKTAVNNFFSNLDDIVVTVNDVLQFKMKQAASDAGRLTLNTTVGLLGLIDVATPIGLEKHNEDFGQTLGFWGVTSGPYLVLPVLGPSSFRDGIGDYADSFLGVWHQVDDISARNSLTGADMLHRRANLLGADTLLDDAALDPYSFMRNAYLLRRQNLVYDGEPPRQKYEDDYEDEEYEEEEPESEPVPPAP
ncbi:MAG: VacJ family lipoprotein [Gallionellaceae bacterium]|jgi:phospholipid-binding lipoprotein MlaA|nr:VacJ family lipoprotein [Gallionellaceae bacterium]